MSFWDYGQPLLLIGHEKTYPPNTRSLPSRFSFRNTRMEHFEQIFTNYTSHSDTFLNTLHAYEETVEYLSTHEDTESDWKVHSLVYRKRRIQLRVFSWDSTNNGPLYIKKIVWSAQGDPISLFGKFFGQQGLGDLYLEVYPNIPIWRHLYFRLIDYKQF